MSLRCEESLPESFWGWRELLKERMCTAETPPPWAGEPHAPYHNGAGSGASEHLVQTIWARQLVSACALRTLGGEPLRVLEPGRWNGAAGPDFKGARLMLGERTLEGDVEIHLSGPDWSVHGHHRDLDYNNVILHVVLRAEDGQSEDELHNGMRVPRLELEPYIFPDLETLLRSISPDDYLYAEPAGLGKCARLMSSLPPAELAQFLDLAGDERLIAKTQRLEIHGTVDPEQVFYQALLLSLGSGAGKTLYYLLAKRVPLAEALEEARGVAQENRGPLLEALLLNVAGLVPGLREFENAVPAPSAAARCHAAELAQVWARLAPFWSDRVIPPTRRWFTGIRPVNFATRRLAGIARLLEDNLRTERGLFDYLYERLRQGAPSLEGAMLTRRKHALVVELTNQLRMPACNNFWATHYSFTAQPSARGMDLIGEGTAQSLVLNAFVPAALWHARNVGDETTALAARRLFALFPPLQSNHITDFMARRLFGDDEQAHKLINTERRRQGLFQVFYHCCKGESAACSACYYFGEGGNPK